jgi:23S rRNA pseudouridine1911/1915/1917 synthase
LRHPVVGDQLYGAPERLAVGGRSKTLLAPLGRNFLHAAKLGFAQPRTGDWIELLAPLPPALRQFLQQVAHAAGDSAERIDAALSRYL